MALPVINENPKYKLTIPSTGQEVYFRPFLVKEQKVLMIALESQDMEMVLKAMVDTSVACIETPINPNTLSTFDVEQIFLKIRTKSVGETTDLSIACNKCQAANELRLNLEEIEIGELAPLNDIKLNDNFSLRLKYPKYNSMINSLSQIENYSGAQLIFETALECLDKLLTENEIISFADEPREEVIKFLDNMNKDQFKEVVDFVKSLPKMTKKIEFKCTECEHENIQILEGIQDFF